MSAQHWIYRVLRRAARGTHDSIPLIYMALFLPDNPVVIEAGAHQGSDTRQMSYLWPGGTIHAFEPVPAVFAQLEANTGDLTNVKRYPVALASEESSKTMYVSSGGTDASSSLLAPKDHLTLNPHVLFQDQVSVTVTTLDTWAAQNDCPTVDFLWLDMQGGELAALQAAPRLLKSVRAIHLEVTLTEIYEGNPLYPEVRAWLESQGFRLEVEEIAYASGGNAFFVRSGTHLSAARLVSLVTRKLLSRKLLSRKLLSRKLLSRKLLSRKLLSRKLLSRLGRP